LGEEVVVSLSISDFYNPYCILPAEKASVKELLIKLNTYFCGTPQEVISHKGVRIQNMSI